MRGNEKLLLRLPCYNLKNSLVFLGVGAAKKINDAGRKAGGLTILAA